MFKNITSFSKMFSVVAPTLDKKNKLVVMANVSSDIIQARFRAIHPAVIRVQINDSYYRCPNHHMSTYHKSHVHGPGCSTCINLHHSHSNLCDRLEVVLDENKFSFLKDGEKLKALLAPLMLEIFDFLPERYQSFEGYDRSVVDSICVLPYRGSDYNYGF